MTGLDKAQNNISFILKILKMNFLAQIHKSENEIVRENVTFCKKDNISIEDFVVPFMHMILKFHKPTLDFRYIAASTKCASKLLLNY